jgi:hypothetical protein
VRRRLTLLAVVAAAALLVGIAAGVTRGGGGDSPARPRGNASIAEVKPPPKPQLPGGGRTIFPGHRVVAYYGAPQAAALGELGIGTPDQAARKLRRQAKPYIKKSRPVLLGMELIVTVAQHDAGTDGLYRFRQPDAIVRRYLRAARRHHALLILDIQPGHANFLDEARHLDKWLREPDVGIALDPEWHTPGAVPGTRIGSVTAEEVNAVARHVAAIVRRGDLPQKLFVIHQFTPFMVEHKQRVITPPELAVTFNVDGFGTPPAKISKYREFTRRRGRYNDGYKLFYHEDTDMMSPRQVLRLRPPPDLIVYE